MLTYTLEKQKKESLYEQLYRFIREDILSGRLHSGERLPSKRTLAQHLEVSTITVKNAYEQLQAEGYIHARQRCGYFVSEVERPPESRQTARPAQAGREREQGWFLDFASGTMDPAYFPFTVWARLMRQTLLEQDKQLLRAAPYNGAAELRRAIAGYLQQFRGMQVDPEQIIVGAGTELLYHLLIQLLGRDKCYAVEDPGYSKIAAIYESNQVQVQYVGIDEAGLSAAQLRRHLAQVVHISPTHHYPTGTVMPIGRRQELLRWAAEQPERYILEDDYDSEFRFSGRPIPALQSLDGGERVVYLNTFAKSLAPSLRISYMVLPPHLLERWRRDFWFYSSTVPSFEQYALARFMERGHFERHLNRTRTRYKARREALLAAARDTGLTRVGSFAGGDAGLHLLLWMDGRWSEAELVARAVDAGVGVAPLSACDLTPPPPGRPPALILGYTRIAAVDMAPALRRLKAAWAF